MTDKKNKREFSKIAIIPSRGCSKRIPRKNLVKFEGLPAFVSTAKFLESLVIFDKVFISSEDEEVLNLSKIHGLDTVRKRPQYLAGDEIPTIQLMQNELQYLESVGITADYVTCVYPLTQLLRGKRLIEGLSVVMSPGIDYVFSAQPSSTRLARLFKVDEKTSSVENLKGFSNDRTQNLETHYFDAGQFYIAPWKSWLEGKEIFTTRSKVITLDKWETIDVDDPEDLELLKALLIYRENRSL